LQTLRWYARRLRAMSAREIISRLRASGRDVMDRCLFPWRRRPLPLSRILREDDSRADGPAAPLTDVAVGEWASAPRDSMERRWLNRLLDKADRIAQHRLSFFDLIDQDLGTPIDWNRDFKNRKTPPMRYARSIDYRQLGTVGDCKFVWEPSRHHQLVVLGRAYRATGNARYARAALEQLESWLDQCPYGIGMNWRSPMELGIRLINWAWMIDLIRPSSLLSEELHKRVLVSVHRHMWEITRQYSAHSSAGNHLIGEAAGVFVAASCFPQLKKAGTWSRQSRSILEEQIIRQTFPDGGGREQAMGYLYFVLQFFLVSGLLARQRGRDFSEGYWSRLEKMLEFAATMLAGGERPPIFGDCDDGYVLDLGGVHGDYRSLLAVGAVLFDRGDFKAAAGGFHEPARWMLGRNGMTTFDAIAVPTSDNGIHSIRFPDAGYALLQDGHRDSLDRISVVFDCGELGFPQPAGHGHADALSFTLRAFGQDVLVDPGTYDYYTYPRWREYFRSTRAHNTVVIDGENQSVIQGRFLWGRRAKAECLAWEPEPRGGKVVGRHDGYARLDDPVIHRRELELLGADRLLVVRDTIRASRRHRVEVWLHLSEDCQVTQRTDGPCRIETPRGGLTIIMDPALAVTMLIGSEDPIGGWVSRGYHRRAEAASLVGRCVIEGPTTLVTRIEIDSPSLR